MGDENYNNQDYTSYIISDSVPLRHLTPNQFYKVCPSSSSSPLGPPRCGDGSPFCFYMTRPPQRFDDDKVLIELLGGGACWDADTCQRQSSYLYVASDQWDPLLLGRSCTEVQKMGIERNNDAAINLLCATVLDQRVDLRRYATIYVPYCTQDVHTGSNVTTYSGDDGDMVVHHTGAHNIISVARYVERQWGASLSTAILTGCSAGGTGVPVLYRLLDRQKTRSLHVITDSPVYLTPSYFVQYALPSWNPAALLRYLGIPYQKLLPSEDSTDDSYYSTRLWEAILARSSSRRHRWGFLSHTNDPVSQAYYQWMSGNMNERRSLEDNHDGDEWYQELTSSIDEIQAQHSNMMDVFWMEGEGHCTLGLYYGLQYEGVEAWAADILQERPPSLGGGWTLALLAGAALAWALRPRRRTDDALLTSHEPKNGWQQRANVLWFSLRQQWERVATVLEPFPVTAVYMVVLSVYFGCMLLQQRLTHPLNNLALGPSAIGLSRYGVLNPTMVVRENWQWYRWISSSFVCTGIITYVLAMVNLWQHVRNLEMEWNNSFQLGLVWVISTVLTNAIFSVVGGGASATALPVILGLSAFAAKALCSKVLLAIQSVFVALVFPLNSWIMMAPCMIVGFCSGIVARRYHNDDNQEDEQSRVGKTLLGWLSENKISQAIIGLAGFLLVMVVAMFSTPTQTLYLEPFYTGCTVFWTDQISSFASHFLSNQDGRRLDEDDIFNGSCAQICVPNIAVPVVQLIARGNKIERGTCTDGGYPSYMFDTTYKYMTYSLDVEVYTLSDDESGNNN